LTARNPPKRLQSPSTSSIAGYMQLHAHLHGQLA